MNSPAKPNFNTLLSLLKKRYPDIAFEQSVVFRWVPNEKVIFFTTKGSNLIWSLLHEVGHMVREHESYSSDIDLLRMEVDAWEEAKKLAKEYNIVIDKDHIEDCIDSYRDWLHKRSSCPVCSQTGLEQASGSYLCMNCRKSWKVSPDRFSRVYRKSKNPAPSEVAK